MGLCREYVLFSPPPADLGAVHAADAGIVSSDIVGYATQSIAGGKLNCAALQFAGIGSENATLANLSSAGLTPGVYDSMETEAPCIMIYNGVGYDYYYYISDGDDGTERFDLTGWTDDGGNLAGEVGIPSTGFWLRIPAATCTEGTLTEAGVVENDATATVTIAAGLTLAGNPYPKALDLSAVVTTGLVAGVYDSMETEAPCIMIYNGVGYNYYYYIADGDDGTERFDLTGWTDDGGNLVDVVAPAGVGFWLRSASAGSLTFAL